MGLAVLAISAQAQAQVKLTWDASRCLPADRDVSGVVATPPNPKTKPPTPGQIKNGSSTPQIVHCPIIRTTSGPGFTDDYLLGADVPVQVPAGKSVSCFASAWSTLIADSQTGNLVEVTPAISGTTVVHVPGLFNTSGYWYGGNPPSGPAKWFYADLSCTLPPQAILKDYQVTEEGADAGYRIYPSTNCSVDGSNTILWEYINSAVEHGTEGGYIRGQSSHDAAKFAMNCPVSNNRVVNFAVSWGGALNLTGCNLNNTDFSRWTWSAVADPQGSAWPTEILPVNPGNPAEPFMTIPLVGTYQLNCGVNGTVGDGKLLSYRSAVQPDRSAWAVSSSTGGVPSGPVTISDARNAKDNNPASRWTTNTVGSPGQWFLVDLGVNRFWSEVSMDSGTSSDDFARGYLIESGAKSDPNNPNTIVWTTVATGTGTSPFVVSKSGVHSSRYVRITLTTGIPHGSWWSIHELNVY